MDYGLSGKRALVLGGSRGLGAACAALLAAEGVEVLAASRSGSASGAGITGVALDLADEAAVSDMAARLADAPVDILINNCGGPKAGPARGQSPQAWRAAFDAMATPVFRLTDAALPGMEAAGWGRIVTIGSSGIEVPIPALALSNGVRGAMAGWSKTLAAEVAARGITVNMVLPGRIATDRLAELDGIKAEKSGQSMEEVQAASRATIPAGRYGRPEEFAAAVAFLCSMQAGYITGSMIRVDGGMIRSL
ncbi:SDR family oxidoreductase [Salipiger marinus]|jgi:3-oxoacyl-[acyl-carrier protein] reductase|uniref:SDR family oxidoreductase n=1 Tax=Salipiger marinus TaxID=555512 RepID=UPI000E9DC6C9|nr:SDR family oxidoreductase [Salipiger manganoxidans]MCD1618544.1 SDR family oxidoreductase [Salipiger manganoxidans]MEB3417729.1 SDR family oxidoreductase [Salipiger manganoxidans]HBM57936.1 3-oxoacyl-ACP reductase [Citreicella sp.]